jgi:Ca2+-binding RTX toxin-like protein
MTDIQPPGTGEKAQLGLQVTSSEPIKLIQSGTNSNPLITAIGSASNDLINAVDSASNSRLKPQDLGSSSNFRYNLQGFSGDDTLRGGRNRDTISGGEGDDLLVGRAGNDSILGGAGNDILRGSGGNDSLIGGPGDDELRGDSGNDQLLGRFGDDVLVPGPGHDTMSGGAGADRFRFEANTTVGSKENADRITDFDPTEDVIEISRNLLPQSNLRPGQLPSQDFVSVDNIKNLASSSNALIVYEQTTGLVYYNSPSGKEIPLFRVQQGLTNITAADFEIF